MTSTILKYLKHLKISFSSEYIEQLILGHPNYPSLLSVADTFDRLGIPHSVRRLSSEELAGLSFPYLLHFSRGHGELILIKGTEDFKSRVKELVHWSGIVIQAEPVRMILDEEHNKRYKEEKLKKSLQLIALTCLVTFLCWPFFMQPRIVYALILSGSFLGIVIGYFLIAKDVGTKYKLIENFCNTGKNSNCDTVLNSEDSRIIGDLKFSDAVLIYFLFQALLLSGSLIIQQTEQDVFLILTGISLLTLPVVAYSIYYQYFRAKSWCRLCLLVDLILVSQLSIFFYSYFTGISTYTSIHLPVAIVTFSLFATIVSGVLLIKKSIERSKLQSTTIVRSNRVFLSPKVFMDLLYQQRKVNFAPFSNELILGKLTAPVKIVVVSNLFCNPCKKRHKELVRLIEHYPNLINMAIRFVRPGKDPISCPYLLEYWLQQTQLKNSLNMEKILDEWFEEMDFKKFKSRYPLIDEEQFTFGGKALSERHYEWSIHAKIVKTPSIFINGYALPENYQVTDLIALIPEMAYLLEKNEKPEPLLTLS